MDTEEKVYAKAPFVPVQNGLWALREAVCTAARNSVPRQGCVIETQEYFYPGELEKALLDPVRMRETFEPLRSFTLGVQNGRLRCALLIDMDTREGIVLHYNGGWQCSYWPIITRRRAMLEWSTRIRMIYTAQNLVGFPLMIKKPILPGRADWGKLLLELLEK